MACWIVRHGPLVREVGPALAYRRYVQDHPLASPVLDAYASSRDVSTKGSIGRHRDERTRPSAPAPSASHCGARSGRRTLSSS